MNEFQLKALVSKLRIKDLRINSFEEARDRNGFPIIMVKMTYRGIPIYTGKRYERIREKTVDFASEKIEYIVTALDLVREGYEDHRIIAESLKWKTISENNQTELNQEYLIKYSSAIKNAAGSTENGLYAIEVLKDGTDKFQREARDTSFEIEYALEKDIERRLKILDFYEKYPIEKSIIDRVKKKINKFFTNK